MQAKRVADQARTASEGLGAATTEQKNRALLAMAEKLGSHRQEVLSANDADVTRARKDSVPDKVVSRLRFGDAKVEARIQSLRVIAGLPDPVGQVISATKCRNGLEVTRVRVPLGVILMIYEARPHVTVNAGALCLKAGNSCILRGGTEAQQCNQLLGELWRQALVEADLPGEAVQVVSGTHEDVGDLLEEEACIDLVIPRGGKGLIKAVSERSRIPVLKHFEGICHVYLDDRANLARGMEVALDSKCLMPEVCNAMETLLVHEALLQGLSCLVEQFRANGVAVKGCETTKRAAPEVELATEVDWRTEYLDLVVSIRVVNDVGEAIRHINTFGSHHTDAIVTDSVAAARRFTRQVDSAVVLVNASTMFCDAASLGMGAEIGIATDKLHARGPMGLEELTSYKLVIRGTGHIMGFPRLGQ